MYKRQTQTLIDKKVVELVKTQHDKALKILQDNIGKLHELAQYLYEHETITGEEFMHILETPPAAVTTSAVQEESAAEAMPMSEEVNGSDPETEE